MPARRDRRSSASLGDIASWSSRRLPNRDRADDLWRTTCFELFVAGEGTAYREYNFSPSGQWAAYDFDDYRAGMRNAPARIETELYRVENNDVAAQLLRSELNFPIRRMVGLTAVIEEADGAHPLLGARLRARASPISTPPRCVPCCLAGVSAE